MRSFYVSLFVFVLLMCSCKTKEVAREVSSYEQVTSDFTSESTSVKQDTTKVEVSQQKEENKVIEETIVTREYDNETGNLTKETETKRTIRQDSKTHQEKTEERGLTEVENDSTNHFVDVHEMVETQEEVKKESDAKTFFVSLGKWLGIIIGIAVLITIVRLINKFRER